MLIESLVPAASTYAKDIDFVWELIFWLVGFWFILSEGVFFWFLFKFKKKDGQKAQYVAGETKAEKKWITYPHLLVLVCDVFIVVAAVRVWYDVKQDLPPTERTVKVIASQWAWTFVHPGPDGKLDTADDIAKNDELHVEVDEMYHYLLESRDVLHDFSVPVFRLKHDAIPGRTITGWFQPTKTGEYDIQCAEICGIGHGLMGARIFIESKEAHETWMQAQVKSADPMLLAKSDPSNNTREQ
jgi:cytochrome c oxidase subunit 2